MLDQGFLAGNGFAQFEFIHVLAVVHYDVFIAQAGVRNCTRGRYLGDPGAIPVGSLAFITAHTGTFVFFATGTQHQGARDQ